MSQVPPELALSIKASYELLDTPDAVSPLNQLIQCSQAPGEAEANLRLRDPQAREELSVTLVQVTIEHERARGAIFFSGTLKDGRQIDGCIRTIPQTEDKELLGTAHITS